MGIQPATRLPSLLSGLFRCPPLQNWSLAIWDWLPSLKLELMKKDLPKRKVVSQPPVSGAYVSCRECITSDLKASTLHICLWPFGWLSHDILIKPEFKFLVLLLHQRCSKEMTSGYQTVNSDFIKAILTKKDASSHCKVIWLNLHISPPKYLGETFIKCPLVNHLKNGVNKKPFIIRHFIHQVINQNLDINLKPPGNCSCQPHKARCQIVLAMDRQLAY